MKAMLLFFIFLTFSLVNAVTILSQDFTSTTFPPTGWTVEGPEPTAWVRTGSNIAGGLPGELGLNYSPSAYGTYKFISPAFDTRKVHDMTLSFRHYLDDYDFNTNPYTIGLMVYSGTTGWSNIWSITTSANIPATLINLTIPFSLGLSVDTKIAFFFEGNNFDIDFWVIDDIVLTYTNTLGSGTWTLGNHYPVGDIIVPDGHNFHMFNGTRFYFEAGKALRVYGSLNVDGTEGNEVLFTSISGNRDWLGIKFENISVANDSSIIQYATVEKSTDSGIYVYYAYKIRIEHSIFRENYATNGGGMVISRSNVIVSDCDIYNNESQYYGAGAYFFDCVANLNGCRIYQNYNNYPMTNANAGLALYMCIVSNVKKNIICNNSSPYATSNAVYMKFCDGVFQRNLVANNSARGIYAESSSVEILNCTIANNEHYGLYNINALTVRNTIFNMNGDIGESDIYNQAAANELFISYSCVPYGTLIIFGNGIAPANFTNNQTDHAQFVLPSDWGPTSDALAADWRPYYQSCTIDTGDPSSPPDPDLSRADIGMHYRLLKPLIKQVIDVPSDQGHQIDLTWNSSDVDVSFYPNAFYSVWREGSSRTDNVVFVSDPSQITPGFQTNGREIVWRDGTRTWFYLQQVWAMNFTDYGWTAPTLQDSSSTGNHDVNFMVAYHNNNGIWQSVPLSGYSVDNIPPYAPAGIVIASPAPEQISLTWEEVTEGGWEGNSYEEINAITYKVYASDTPYFEISPATYLLSTTNPNAVLNSQTSDRKFYKIIAVDSE